MIGFAHNIPVRYRIVPKSANYIAKLSDYTIDMDASDGVRTVTLPTAASAYNTSATTSLIFVLYKNDATGNAVRFKGNGSELIDGANIASITLQYDSITVQSTGTKWIKI